MARFAAFRPDHDHHAAEQEADRDDPNFTIVEPVVRELELPSANTSTASKKSRLRSRSVASRFAGSKVIFTG
jgi:hypothetical protein